MRSVATSTAAACQRRFLSVCFYIHARNNRRWQAAAVLIARDRISAAFFEMLRISNTGMSGLCSSTAPESAPSATGSGPATSTVFFGPHESTAQVASRLVQQFLQPTSQVVDALGVVIVQISRAASRRSSHSKSVNKRPT